MQTIEAYEVIQSKVVSFFHLRVQASCDFLENILATMAEERKLQTGPEEPPRLSGGHPRPLDHAQDVLPGVRVGRHERLHADHRPSLEGRRCEDAAGRLPGHAARVLGPEAPDSAGEEVRGRYRGWAEMALAST